MGGIASVRQLQGDNAPRIAIEIRNFHGRKIGIIDAVLLGEAVTVNDEGVADYARLTRHQRVIPAGKTHYEVIATKRIQRCLSIIVWKHPGIHHRVIAREGGAPQHRVRRRRGFGAEIANLCIDHHHANVLVGEQHSRTCREVRLDVQRIPFRKRRRRHHGAIDDAGRERGDLLIPALAFHRGLSLGFGLGIPVLLQVGACL